MEINPHEAINYMIKNAEAYAKAKANVVYLEQYRKTKKAICFQSSLRSTMAEKEADAYAHPDYIAVLDGLKDAVEEAERLRWMLVAAQARIDVFRTQEASNRRIDRNTQ
jgi:predicted transposase YbfD/YdcC